MNRLGFVSLVIIVSITALRFFPATFDHANVVADSIFDVSVGYMAAWFFNLLVIEGPARQRRKDIFSRTIFRIERHITSAPREIINAIIDAIVSEPEEQATLKTRFNYVFSKDDFSNASDRISVTSLLERCVSAPPERQQVAREMIRSIHGRGLREFSSLSDVLLSVFGPEFYIQCDQVVNARLFEEFDDPNSTFWRTETEYPYLANSLNEGRMWAVSNFRDNCNRLRVSMENLR